MVLAPAAPLLVAWVVDLEGSERPGSDTNSREALLYPAEVNFVVEVVCLDS